MENIIKMFESQDLYMMITLGLLFLIVFVTVLYKKINNGVRYHSADDFETNDSNIESTSVEDVSSSNEGLTVKITWLIIDGISIITFTVILYVLVWKKTEYSMVKSIVSGALIYYMLFKATLLKTK